MGSSDGDGDGRIRPAMSERRARMVEEQLVRRHIRDERVLEAMGRIERHRFVPPEHVESAYGDHPVPAGCGQTLSQPYIVALMTEALHLDGSERVLEIGTGTGYQTAVLAELAREVYTIEVKKELAETARLRLEEMGYDNIQFRTGNGRDGWPEAAPFDGILVAAAPDAVPPRLQEQLAPEGRLILPLGPSLEQELELVMRDPGAPSGFRTESLGPVRFVPLL